MSSHPIDNLTIPVQHGLSAVAANAQQTTRLPPVNPAEKPASVQEKRQEEINQPKPAELKTSMEELNRQLQQLGTRLQFSVDSRYEELVIKVMDTESREVIRQIPAEEALAIARFFRDLEKHLGAAPAGGKARSGLVGMLVDTES